MPAFTPIHFEIKQYLDEQYTRLDKEKITHWLMRFSANIPTDIDDCRGGRIKIGGVRFEGSPRDVFWSFIRPCLQDIIAEALKRVDEIGRKYRPKTVHAGFDETAVLLKQFITRVYRRMIEIDRRLRGNGDPASVSPYDPSDLIRFLHTQIDERTATLKAHYPVGLRRLWASIQDDPKLILTTFGIGTVVGGLLLALMKSLIGL